MEIGTRFLLMAKGIQGSTGNVLDSVKTLVGKVHEGMADISTFRLPEVNIPQFNANGWNIPQPALAGGTTRTTNLGGVHITVNGYNARNDDELAQIVADKINDMIDQDDSVYK